MKNMIFNFKYSRHFRHSRHSDQLPVFEYYVIYRKWNPIKWDILK